MRKDAKERALDCLILLNQKQTTVSAKQIAAKLGISRQNTSHYLNRLLRENKVEKIPGKPVLWKVREETKVMEKSTGQVFKDVIGYDGSLREVIQQCIAAVKYPPKGLNLLLNGKSGVGKSFLAEKIFEYAKEKEIIGQDAPFMVLNCADYADNPELLSATLFGYKKGAFTGAQEDTLGILASADRGYLFLDEVHRLSSENQEKLFLFMDSGKYRPLGESTKWSRSSVRFIFATTEKSEDVLLDTFARRIEISLELPSFSERPISEKLQLVQAFFQNEADILNRNIRIQKEVLSLLLRQNIKGNIGKLKNIVKKSCANAFSQTHEKTLLIAFDEVLKHTETKVEDNLLPLEDLLIRPNEEKEANHALSVKSYSALNKVLEIIKKDKMEDNGLRVKQEMQKFISETTYNVKLSKAQNVIALTYQKIWRRIVVKKYGLVNSVPDSILSSQLYVLWNDAIKDESFEQSIEVLAREFPRAFYVVERFLSQLPKMSKSLNEFLKIIITIQLTDHIDEMIELKGLLLAHGDSTASSIQAVVNQLCKNYVFEAIDMPVESNVNEIVELTKTFMNEQVNTDSLVLIVDMGSLSQIYTQIKTELKGELLLLNNLTTSIALDIGLKMLMNSPFDKIAEDASGKYSINAQYFEGFSRTENIIVSCMSGLGISDKLKEIFSEHLTSDYIEVFTKDYRDLRTLIDENDESYFDKTKLVITTSDLPKSFTIPNVNIYNILDNEGAHYFEKQLEGDISHKDFQALMKELVRFFSLEGVVDRLNFLNPTIVMGEVETVISKYEAYYHFILDGKLKLNLYMHTALMMERLFLARTEKSEEPQHELSAAEEEFYYISKSIFLPMEMKYNFTVNSYELSLLYELLSPYI